MVHSIPLAVLPMFLIRSRALVRTGFFRSDPPPGTTNSPYYFIDPEAPLFATANEFRYTDDPTMQSAVLERSNVGMGMLLVNADKANMQLTNSLYRRLRDLEVNTLKRFTAVTRSDRKSVVGPQGLRELLMLAEARKLDRPTSEMAGRYINQLARNQADLALVVADYYKPLVTLLDGQDSGVAIASLANTSGCYSDSKMAFEFTKYGSIPTGGLSFALAKTPWFIGEFLALTGRTITGANIIYSGLARRWISPEALPFMEVTSEHKLEVSEKDATVLLSEHFLTPPSDWVLKPYVGVINDVFSNHSVPDMIRSLKRIGEGTDPKLGAFAKECADRMMAASPLSLHLTNKLIKSARRHVANVTNALHEEEGGETVNFIQNKPRLLQEHISRPAMILSLKDEVRAVARLIDDPSLSTGLHAYITGTPVEWGTSVNEFAKGDIEAFLAPLAVEQEYRYSERTDFPLSAHPKLRKFHPDFDPRTGLDHDPAFMARETERWSEDFMSEERDALRSGVSGMSVAQIRANRSIKWE